MTRRRVPWVGQMEVADCGAACLAMVLAYYGKQVALEELRHTTSTNRDGVDARAMVAAARGYGLNARGVAADLDDLPRLPPGSILHWEFNHFVVFERVGRRGVHIVDPAVGRRRVSRKMLGRSYTGVAIQLEPAEEFEPSRRKTRATWRYLRPLLGESKLLTRVLLMSVLLRLLALALPIATGLLVDQVIPNGDRHLLTVIGATMIGVVGYYLLSAFLRAHLLLQLRTILDVRLTRDFVEHMVALPYSFFLGRSAGDLMMRLQSNTVVRETLTSTAMSALLDGTLAILYLILLAVVSLPLAAVVLLLGALQVVALVLSWRRSQSLMSESLQVKAKSESYTYELLAGIETLKAAGAEPSAAKHWERLFINQVRVDLARGRLNAGVQTALDGLSLASPLAVLIVGGFQVLDGNLSLGTMLAAGTLASGFLQPLGTLVSTGLGLQSVRSYMDRINDVLDMPREQEGQQVVPAPPLHGHVLADNVSFAYGLLSPPVVRDVTLQVTPGQTVGIVGRSGAGKSTLARLLLGLYRPTAGQIRLDGINIDDVEVTSLRRQFGIVTQRPYLFASTIRDNIALTDPTVPLEAVVSAAELACIHHSIESMPLGYETLLVDAGASLSGGEQQRVALARALVHRPALLLLDEATSDLDTVTERELLKNLRSLDSTTIVIAHRLSTVKDADLILVMEDGRVIEQGNHDELLARQGVYRELFEATQMTALQPRGAVLGPRPDGQTLGSSEQ